MAGEVLWRDTGIPPKIGTLDARAIFPLALWAFHWAWWTAAIALAAVIALYLVQRTGMTPIGCVRVFRVAILGKRRETRNHESQWRKRTRW
jgi:intracellular multiplication protein IcmT